MLELRNIAALNRNLKRLFVVTGAGIVYSFSPLASAHAEEPTTEPTSSTNDTSTVTSVVSEPQTQESPTVQAVTQEIQAAQTTLDTVVSAATSYQVSQNTEVIQAAETAITNATTAVEVATSAAADVQTATTVVSTATAELTTAQTALTVATDAVTAQEAVVTQETNELSVLQNLPVGQAVTYTTDNYVAPVAPETPTVTTTTLPEMWDAATQIQTPFDIKMGDTVFNGQGTNSQIYVSSKAIISFGGPDYTYWNWPNATQDGIYVFQSDYMSAGPGASIVVTTTETTLSVDWTLHRFGDTNGPLTYISWDMTVNPETGEWTGTGSMSGNTEVYGGPRTGVRQDNVLKELPTYTDSSKTAAVDAQQAVVTQETAELTTLQATQTNAETVVVEKQTAVTTATTNLTTAQNVYNVAIATADSLAQAATAAVATVVAAVSNTPTQAPQPVQPVLPDPGPSSDANQDTNDVQSESPQDSNTDSSSEEQQNQDTEPSPEDTTDEVPVDDTDTPEDSSQPSTDTPSDSSTDLPDTDTPSESTDSESDQQTSNPTEEPSSDTSDATDTSQPTTEESTQTNQSSESSKPPTSPDSLPETTPLLPPASALVPRVQADIAGVVNGGIQFYGTKSQPQVIGEDGKLTPPPPPPGSGLPIPPDAITTTETFIGQPGGTTFNAPDIAVPVEPIEVNIEIPGVGEAAQALANAYVALANIGNDMSPITRKKAKKVLVATLVVGQIAAFRRRFGE